MALTPDPDNEFEKKGVTFKVITPDMLTQVEDFMWKNFFPDEPVSRLNESMFNKGAFKKLVTMKVDHFFQTHVLPMPYLSQNS